MDTVFRGFNSKRRYGVELEVGPEVSQKRLRELISSVSEKEILINSAYDQSIDNSYWHVKYDSSCGPPNGYHSKTPGWEVASFVAKGAKDLLHISEVANVLNAADVRVNKNCGLHVHVNVEDLTCTNIGILMARWIKIESLVSKMLPKHRKINKYCRMWKNVKRGKYNPNKQYAPDEFWYFVQPTNLQVHENPQKKMSLNLVSYTAALTPWNGPPRKTIEFRLPEGTLDGYEVRNWVKFFLGFTDAAATSSMPENIKQLGTIEDLLRYVGLEHEEKFYLLSKGLLETKRWILERIITHGTRKFAEKAHKKLELIQ